MRKPYLVLSITALYLAASLAPTDALAAFVPQPVPRDQRNQNASVKLGFNNDLPTWIEGKGPCIEDNKGKSFVQAKAEETAAVKAHNLQVDEAIVQIKSDAAAVKAQSSELKKALKGIEKGLSEYQRVFDPAKQQAQDESWTQKKEDFISGKGGNEAAKTFAASLEVVNQYLPEVFNAESEYVDPKAFKELLAPAQNASQVLDDTYKALVGDGKNNFFKNLFKPTAEATTQLDLVEKERMPLPKHGITPENVESKAKAFKADAAYEWKPDQSRPKQIANCVSIDAAKKAGAVDAKEYATAINVQAVMEQQRLQEFSDNTKLMAQDPAAYWQKQISSLNDSNDPLGVQRRTFGNLAEASRQSQAKLQSQSSAAIAQRQSMAYQQSVQTFQANQKYWSDLVTKRGEQQNAQRVEQKARAAAQSKLGQGTGSRILQALGLGSAPSGTPICPANSIPIGNRCGQIMSDSDIAMSKFLHGNDNIEYFTRGTGQCDNKGNCFNAEIYYGALNTSSGLFDDAKAKKFVEDSGRKFVAPRTDPVKAGLDIMTSQIRAQNIESATNLVTQVQSGKYTAATAGELQQLRSILNMDATREVRNAAMDKWNADFMRNHRVASTSEESKQQAALEDLTATIKAIESTYNTSSLPGFQNPLPKTIVDARTLVTQARTNAAAGKPVKEQMAKLSGLMGEYAQEVGPALPAYYRNLSDDTYITAKGEKFTAPAGVVATTRPGAAGTSISGIDQANGRRVECSVILPYTYTGTLPPGACKRTTPTRPISTFEAPVSYVAEPNSWANETVSFMSTYGIPFTQADAVVAATAAAVVGKDAAEAFELYKNNGSAPPAGYIRDESSGEVVAIPGLPFNATQQTMIAKLYDTLDAVGGLPPDQFTERLKATEALSENKALPENERLLYGGLAALMQQMQAQKGSVVRTRPVLGFGDLKALDEAASKQLASGQTPALTSVQKFLDQYFLNQLDFGIRQLGSQNKGLFTPTY